MPPRTINQGWAPPGTHSDTTKHRYDLKRGWIKPGDVSADHGLQFVGEGQGFDPSKKDAAWHTVISPKGVSAPLGSINYTPATGEVHAPGMQAPVNEDNVSLMPLDSFSFGNDMVGTGQTAVNSGGAGGGIAGDVYPTGLEIPGYGPTYFDDQGNVYFVGIDDDIHPVPEARYDSTQQSITDSQGTVLAGQGATPPAEGPMQGPPVPVDTQRAPAAAQTPAAGSPPPAAAPAKPATGNDDFDAFVAALGTQHPGVHFQRAYDPASNADYAEASTDNGTSWTEVPNTRKPARPPAGPITRNFSDHSVRQWDGTKWIVIVEPPGPAAKAPPNLQTRNGPNGPYQVDPATGTSYTMQGAVIAQGARGGQPGAQASGGQQQPGGLPGVASQMATTYGLDPDVFMRMLAQESGWNPNNTSPAGAKGVAQFMPGTAEYAAKLIGVTPEQFWADPKLQIQGAAALMSEYVTKYKGDYRLALIAYNAGPGVADAAVGQPDPRLNNETTTFLDKIIGAKQRGEAIPGLDNPSITSGGAGAAGGPNPFAPAPKAPRTQVVTGPDGKDRLINVDTGEVIKDLPGSPQDPRTKPIVAGNRIVQFNPETGKYDTVYQGPTQHQTAQSGGHLFSIDPETQEATSLYDTPGKPQMMGGDVFLPPDVGYKRVGWTGPSGLNQPEQNFAPTAKIGWDLPSWVKRGPGGAGSQGPVQPPRSPDGVMQPWPKPMGGNGLDPNDPLSRPPIDQSTFVDQPPLDFGMGQAVGSGQEEMPPKLGWDKMAVSVGVGGADAPIPPIDPSQIVGGGNKFGQQVSMEGVHQGTDLQAYEGTPVIAPVAGVVVRVDSDPQGLGLQVHIRSDDGHVYTVAHLAKSLVTEGQRVEQGQPIAHVGESGAGATGPHLDYRIQSPDGQYVNPEPQLGRFGKLPEAPNTIQEGQAKPQLGEGQGEVPDLAMQDPAALQWDPSARGRQVQQQSLTPVDELGAAPQQDDAQPEDDSQDWLGQTPQQPQLQQVDQGQPQQSKWHPYVQGEADGGMGTSIGGASGGMGPSGGAAGGMAGGTGDVAQAALSDPDKWTLCGPVAAVIAAGNGWTVDQAKQFAQQNGLWDAQGGMHGLQSEIQMLKGMGVDADVGPAHPDLIAKALAMGVYPIISTPNHYFTIKGFDPGSGAYNVSTTGTALRGGSEWMTLDQIQQMGGGIDGAAYIRKPGATGGGQASVGTGQGQWVGKGDAWGTDSGGGMDFSPFSNDLTSTYNQYSGGSNSGGGAQAQASAPQWQDTGPTIYETEQLQHQQEQIDNNRRQIDNAARAESQRHQEAMASAKNDAARIKEQSRHDKAMEQLQAKAQELQKQEDQYKAYNDSMNRNAQYNIQGTFGQQQQSKLLQSALTNPWLQSLTGMAPGYGAPGWNAQQGGVLQSLLNGWNPQQTPDFSMQEQVPKPPNWVKLQGGSSSGGNSQAAAGGGGNAQGNVQAAGGGKGSTDPMAAIMGQPAGASGAGYGGYAPLGSAPPTPDYGQWQKMSPFERASWRTLSQSAEPFPLAVQQSREKWAQGGVFDAPNAAKLSATQMDPLGIMGQNQTAEMFGQSPENYWKGQSRTWSASAAPSITQVDQ